MCLIVYLNKSSILLKIFFNISNNKYTLAKQLTDQFITKLIMLNPSDLKVLKQIAFRENGSDGFCWERKKNIAWRNKLSRQTVHKAYKRLEKANLIKVYHKEINNKIFVCANTKELGFFIGNFLLYCLRNNLTIILFKK